MTESKLVAKPVLVLCGLMLSFPASVGFACPQGAVPGCRSSQLTLAVGPLVSEATGQHTLSLRLINRGTRTCAVRGYPSVWFEDGQGTIPFVISHRGDQMVTSKPPTRVLVRPARSAWVLLNHYRCDRGRVRAASIVRLGLAGTTRRVSLRLRMRTAYSPLDYCGVGDPGSTVAVSPFEPTLRAGLRF